MNALLNLLRKLLATLRDPASPVLRVLLGGGAGGALGVMAGTMLGEITTDWWRIIVPCVALGAGAAFIAVFVLLGIKTEDVHRCCGVALMAGFFWQPVFAAGKDYLINKDQREAEVQVAKKDGELKTVLGDLRQSPTNAELVAQAGALADSLTRETADLRRGSLKSQTQSTVVRTIDALAAVTANHQQPGAAAALLTVAETAYLTGNRTVADKARAQVERLTVPPELALRKMRITNSAVGLR